MISNCVTFLIGGKGGKDGVCSEKLSLRSGASSQQARPLDPQISRSSRILLGHGLVRSVRDDGLERRPGQNRSAARDFEAYFEPSNRMWASCSLQCSLQQEWRGTDALIRWYLYKAMLFKASFRARIGAFDRWSGPKPFRRATAALVWVCEKKILNFSGKGMTCESHLYYNGKFWKNFVYSNFQTVLIVLYVR